MGKKKTEDVPAAPKVEENKPVEDEDEDEPVIKTLKEIDERYCKIETEYEIEVEKLRKKYYNERQAALIAERAKLLAEGDDKKTGTPACKGFWLTAMQNEEAFAEILEEWDDPVLEYLTDIKSTDIDDAVPQKGYKIEFCFKENEFFSNESLWVEFTTNFDAANNKPWKQPDCIEMKASIIDWKPGMNVTVAVTQKKKTGGGAKKKKQAAKQKEEDRPSFFRAFFRNLKEGGDLPPDLMKMMAGAFGAEDDEDLDLDDDDREQMLMGFMSNCYELSDQIKQGLIPYAVRYYTGEACEEPDDDEESEEEDDDEDDDDDEESDEPPPTKKSGAKKGGKSAGGDAPGGKKEEECKQQ